MTTRLPAAALLLALAAAMPAAAAERLGIGDTVSVTVFGRTDLSGQFPIGPDAAINLPLAGSVPAAGRSRHELEQAVRERLSHLLAYDAQVTVDVATYQPVYVIGDVVTPGEHAFLPGMTALKAYARAGGTPTVYQTQTNSQAFDAVAAERDLRLAQTDLFAWLIRRAALDAALGGAPEITLPPELEPVRKAPLVAEMMGRESALLASDQASFRQARQLGEQQKIQLDNEIQALEGERVALNDQRKYVEAELANMERLQKKGLTTNARLIDLQAMKSDLDADNHRLSAFMSRARQGQVTIEMRLLETADAWRRERQAQRVAAAAEVERARTRLETARMQLSALGQVSVADVALGRTELGFRITRTEGDATRVIEAKGNTPLLPGDVLEVQMRMADETAAPVQSSALPAPASLARR